MFRHVTATVDDSIANNSFSVTASQGNPESGAGSTWKPGSSPQPLGLGLEWTNHQTEFEPLPSQAGDLMARDTLISRQGVQKGLDAYSPVDA